MEAAFCQVGKQLKGGGGGDSLFIRVSGAFQFYFIWLWLDANNGLISD